jgi:acyl-CoA synthetase (AMP-forming)/AMP-acid ligase II
MFGARYWATFRIAECRHNRPQKKEVEMGTGSDSLSGSVFERNATVASLVEHIYRQDFGQVAIEGEDGRCWTIGELRDEANRIMNALRGQGLMATDRVMYIGRNLPEFLAIDCGLAAAGLVKVPVNFRLSAEEIEQIVSLVGPRAVIADHESASALVDCAWSGDTVSICINRTGQETPPGWSDYDTMMGRASSVASAACVRGSDLYQIRLTSGSTGRPKGVLTTHFAAREAILGNLWVLGRELGRRPPRNLVLMPATMQTGWTLLPTLMLGGTNVIRSRYAADRLIADVVSSHITTVNVVPTILRDLAQCTDVETLASADLEAIVYAGEPAPREAVAALWEHTKSLVQTYGQTEAPSWTTWLSSADHADPELRKTVGRSTPRNTWAVLDDDGAPVAESGVMGELAIRGGSITAGLLGAEDEYRERLVGGVWWCTGDVGHIDDRGYITVVQRKKEMIISGGSNIYPGEIENALLQHPAVQEAAVFGVPDLRWGERPIAVVYGRALADRDVDGMGAWLQGRVARYKIPKTIERSAQPLPRQGEDGKLAKGRLRAAYLEDDSR